MPHAVVVTVREEGRPPSRRTALARAVSSLDSRPYDPAVISRTPPANSKRRARRVASRPSRISSR